MAVVNVACSGNNSNQKSDNESRKREKRFFDFMLKLSFLVNIAKYYCHLATTFALFQN
jgi:hypothetical protein